MRNENPSSSDPGRCTCSLRAIPWRTASRTAQPAKAIAPIDLTGYWVSIVSEDWRFRMIAAPKGDFAGVPLESSRHKVAKEWDPAKDEAAGNQCKAYGAAGLMRIPTRLHITWQDDNTLKIEADAGTQTRLLHFGPPQPPSGPPTLQGYSAAEWHGSFGGVGYFGTAFDPTKGGSLEVNTSHLAPGYLRRNGVPYSDKTTVQEFYDVIKEPEADWIVVKTIVIRSDVSVPHHDHQHALPQAAGRHGLEAVSLLRPLAPRELPISRRVQKP